MIEHSRFADMVSHFRGCNSDEGVRVGNGRANPDRTTIRNEQRWNHYDLFAAKELINEPSVEARIWSQRPVLVCLHYLNS
jgi:hypothetical protein